MKKSALMAIAFAALLMPNILVHADTITAIYDSPEPVSEESVEDETEETEPQETEIPEEEPQTDSEQEEASPEEETEDTPEPDTEISGEELTDLQTSTEDSAVEESTDSVTDTKEETTSPQKTSSIPQTIPDEDPTLHPISDASEVDESIAGFSIDISSYPPADTSENTKYIYQYLTEELELNHAAACGVLANIQLESGFNQFALGDGGTSYGICQWHNERFSRLMSYCVGAGFDYNTLDGQLAYLKYELSAGYSNVFNHLLQVSDTADGAYDAAYYWCVYFEAPSQVYARAAQRGNLAKYEYFPLDLSIEDSLTELAEAVDNWVFSEETAEKNREAAADVRSMMDENSKEADRVKSYANIINSVRRDMKGNPYKETEEINRQAAASVRVLMDANDN